MLPRAIAPYIGDPVEPEPDGLPGVLVDLCHMYSTDHGTLGDALAAAFDLCVAASYYDSVLPENWLWCEEHGVDIYTFTNACPLCALENRFVYHEGHKPGSGRIGAITAGTLRRMIAEQYRHSGLEDLVVSGGREPVDLAIHDPSEEMVFCAEVKASPLHIPSLVVEHSAAQFQTTSRMPEGHSAGILRNIEDCPVSLLFPTADAEPAYLALPNAGVGRPGWAGEQFRSGFDAQPTAFGEYLGGWREMWRLYQAPRDEACQVPSFWLTGACGRPTEVGRGWPTDGRGRPQGSISDSKTSVGMDRTDDIKKSTFQVLMMGVDLHSLDSDGWGLRIGLASNLHAGRHHEDYLSRYDDIAWGWLTDTGPPEDWHRLFDAIVSFTAVYTYDPWLGEVFNWQ